MRLESSILPFSRKIDELRFSVQSVEIELWKRYRDSEPVLNKHAVIVLQNKMNGRLCIHPLTEFIFPTGNTERIILKGSMKIDGSKSDGRFLFAGG
ncbi:hypothetical protein ABER23_06790 [Paenibacillus lautus]|uniref:hypothetical protein n=1 Tax=Paenibacillus lautus TaxID=1401 RepID=UPI003D2C442D